MDQQQHELGSLFAAVEEEERRSNIERIVTSYRHPWDVYTELLQNSVDAIFEAKEILHAEEPEWKGNIEIVVDSKNRHLRVSDNGIGIPPEKIGQVIVLGRSLKRESQQSRYGFMGFGLTFVAFQSSYIKIESIHQGKKSLRSYRNLHAYIFKGATLPDADEKPAPKNVKQPHATIVEVEFQGAYPELRPDRQSDIDKLFGYAENPKLLECILRTKTAVGNTRGLFDNKPLCDIQVTAVLNEKRVKIPFKYLDLLEVLNTFKVSAEIRELSAFEQLVALTEDDPRMERDRKRKVKAIWYATQKPTDVGERSPIKADFYIFATSKDYLNRYNREVLKLNGDSPEGLSNGIFLSLDGMPTSIRLDNWTHSSYLPFTVIVDAQSLHSDLDAGRKGITSYRASQLVEEAERLLIKEKKFMQYRRYVVDGALTPPTMTNAKDRMLEDVSKNKTRHPNARLCQQWLPPHEEQEVIALFMELVGRERFKGYYLMMLSGYEKYDGLFEYRLRLADNHTFDEVMRPFSVLQATFEANDGTLYKNLLVEFKLYLESIYADIHHNRKDLREVDLIVCWEANADKIQKDWGDELVEIDENERLLDGVTHKLKCGEIGGEIPVICLKTFLDRG